MGGGWGGEQSFEVFLDVVFMLDIALSFVTCYDDQVGVDVMSV